ncbi:Pcc1-domain-containing protein [Trichoderma citrinoviride]|uniref:Pcc1-domain-containing protein n=1 Tax=Trichoderma citrinoviride TaxID=58853 RepID=A0A2T4B148_9HYPO|nr:Pcc1-domain-containing protein [Trichoderma citrinoviride]PTB62958.1 Pcc1-domain-containing protein [Trichoderma citrinoviride]
MGSDSSFPCSMQLHIPFPTPRLASTALKALQVDPELSPLVQRTLSVDDDDAQVLRVEYRATTNRMLRVAVNSFMEGLKLVLEVMEQLDVDVLAAGEQKSSIQSP